jgi:hypothetical protein
VFDVSFYSRRFLFEYFFLETMPLGGEEAAFEVGAV